MKTIKITFLLIIATILLCGYAQSAPAYDFKVGQLYYKIVSAELKTARVEAENLTFISDTKSRYTSENNKPTGAIIIPETVSYDGINYTVTGTGPETFRGCTGITSIGIPYTVTQIGLGFDIVGECDALTTFTVSEENKNFSAVNGVLFNKDKSTIIRYPEGKSADTYAIPASVKTIGYMCFNNSKIKSMIIPSTVTSIKQSAFTRCKQMTSFTIPNSITKIEDNTFYNSGLTSIIIPNTVTTIGEFAFNNCIE